MNTLSKRNEYVLASLLLLYCFYDLGTAISLVWNFSTDDAYISWVYARHLVQGEGLTWHLGLPHVEGFSNFLWTMIAALVLKLKLPLVSTMKGIAITSLVASMGLLYRLARLFFSPLLAMLPVFIFSHYLGVVWWTLSGLETLFYVAWSLLLTWQLLKAWGYEAYPNESSAMNSSNSAWFWVNFSLLILSLTRFEGFIWSIPVMVFSFIQWKGRARECNPALSTWGAISFFTFVLPYVIYFGWRLFYFGHWIPNSYQCKALAKSQLLVVDGDYFQVLVPFLVAALPYLIFKKDIRKVLLWLPSLLYALLLLHADPVIAHFLRLFMAPFALFTLLPVLGVREFLGYFNPRIDPKWITSIIIILMTVLFLQGNDRDFLIKSTTHYEERSKNRMAVAEFLNLRARKNDLVLLDDCGLVPFMARGDIRFLDAQCLNNAEMTQASYKQHPEKYAIHLKESVKPDWVVVNFYPLEQRGDLLNELLIAGNFYADYALLKTYESGFEENGLRTVDYIYKVYMRLK